MNSNPILLNLACCHHHHDPLISKSVKYSGRLSETEALSSLRDASKSMDRDSWVEGDTNRILWLGVVVVSWKWEFAKWESWEIRENDNLQTHLKRIRDLTGNLRNIWMINSWGRNMIDLLLQMMFATFLLNSLHSRFSELQSL